MNGRRSAVLLLLIACVATGCSDDDDASSDGTPFFSPLPVPTAPSGTGCAPGYGLFLEIRADLPEEEQYLSDMTACTDAGQTATWLGNESEVVWTIQATPGGADVDQLTSGLRLDMFRADALEVYPNAVLAPGSQVVVHATPSAVSFFPHHELSLMWLAHDTLVDVVEDTAQEQVIDLTSGVSARRRAIATCSFAAYNTTRKLGEFVSESDRVDQLLAAVGIGAAASECRQAWQAADDFDLNRGVRPPTWADEVVPLRTNPSVITKLDDGLGALNVLRKALNIVF